MVLLLTHELNIPAATAVLTFFLPGIGGPDEAFVVRVWRLFIGNGRSRLGFLPI
jgi:hypothetical protein